jgi:hypothetical protein
MLSIILGSTAKWPTFNIDNIELGREHSQQNDGFLYSKRVKTQHVSLGPSHLHVCCLLRGLEISPRTLTVTDPSL